MIYYRPTEGDVHNAAIKWRPRTCFVMSQMGAPVPAEVRRVRRSVDGILRRRRFMSIDAGSKTTGKDYLLKIWTIAVSCPVGIAIIHEGISAETLANIYYEFGWMQAYGRETVVIKIGSPKLPSDLVRSEHIAFGPQFSSNFGAFLDSLVEQAAYFVTLARQLETNPLLAIDYLRRAFLLKEDKSLRREARELFSRAGLDTRAKNSVERCLIEF